MTITFSPIPSTDGAKYVACWACDPDDPGPSCFQCGNSGIILEVPGGTPYNSSDGESGFVSVFIQDGRPYRDWSRIIGTGHWRCDVGIEPLPLPMKGTS